MTPLSLLTRTNLVLGLGSLLIVVITLVALVEMVVRPIGERWARDQAALIELTAKTWVELPPVARPFFELELAANHAIIVTEDVRMLDPLASDFTYADLLQTALSERLNRPVTLMESEEMIWVTVSMGDHQLQFGFDESSIEVNVMLAVLVIVTLMAVIVFLTSFLLVRRIARPLMQVSEAVSDFRGGGGFEPLPEKGPSELLRLVRSFNVMAAEVSELLSSRDTLLAGISHDLRTPLTRMRLALELLPDSVDNDVKQRFERNMARMDGLLGDALLLARGIREDAIRIDLRETLNEIVQDFDVRVLWLDDAKAHLRVRVARAAFRRVLQNLLENARRHGGGGTEVLVRQCGSGEAANIEIHVQDRGPGIPSQDRSRVFMPFVRLGDGIGSGLGLSIVRQLCDMYGWEVALLDRPGGGTDACIRLGRNNLIQIDTGETYSGNAESAEWIPVD